MIGTSVSQQNRVPVTMATRVVPAVSWIFKRQFLCCSGAWNTARRTDHGQWRLRVNDVMQERMFAEKGPGFVLPGPSAMELLFPVLGEFVGGDWRPATRLPRAYQTCSIGSMSGEHTHHSIRTIPSSKRISSTRLERCGLQLSSIKMKSSPIAAA
ncbi:hypothetical protein TNCV_106461 [Trichonephila clavipes]|nr:hypothetical protein TNCV_106461 [Trichonephila clavipes]